MIKKFFAWGGKAGTLLAGAMLLCPAAWSVLLGGSGLPQFSTANFSGSGICAMCHDHLTDASGADVSIAGHWRATMMANAARDPLWQAKMSTEVLRNPEIAGVIEAKCSRCHTPMARVEAVTAGTPVTLLHGGFLDPANLLNEAAMDGVSCTLCHQIQPTNLGTPESFSGQYVIDTGASAENRALFGQFAGPFQRPMTMWSGFVPLQGAHMSDAALCGICHTLYTPARDASGAFTQEFPEQMTYPEWLHSRSGGGTQATCADCHMPMAAGAAPLSAMPMCLGPRAPFAGHQFTGANVAMLGLLKSNTDGLGITASPTQLDDNIARTVDLLTTKTADLTVTGASLKKKVLRISLNVANKTGHKLPTGVPFRRAWIDLSVQDATGKTFFESGRPNPNGSIRGCDADGPGNAYERHHAVINSPKQVQIYESVMGDLSGAVTYTLLDSAYYLKDNRLLPVGFSKSSASEDIAVLGDAATDGDFVGGGDVVRYKIRTQGRPRPFTVTATLYYQSVSFAGARDLMKTDTAQVQAFAKMYASADAKPVVVKRIQKTVR